LARQRLLDLEDQTDPVERELGPAVYPKDDDKDPADYAVYSRALLDEGRQAMEPIFITWTQNLLFLAGLQWWAYDKLTGAFLPQRSPKWKEKPVRNLLVPYFKHVMAKLTKNRPRSKSVPASTDPEDIQAGLLGDDVLKAKWIELKVTRILKRAIAWLIGCGNVYLQPFWNEDSGLLVPLTTLVQAEKVNQLGEVVGMEAIECPCDEQGEPLLDEQGNYDIEGDPHYVDMGEVGYKVRSPFQVFVDPGAEGDEDVTYMLIVEAMTLREIHRRWPDVEEQVVAEDTQEIDRFDSLISGLSAGSDTYLEGQGYSKDSEVPKALVCSYNQRPSQDYPQGRNWVSVGRQLLDDPGPLPDGIWPVVTRLTDIEVPGRYHSEATMTSAVGLQREYNEVNAQIKEHHNILLRGKWLVPIGSNIRRGQITSEPGEVIQHTPGLPPVMADLRALPNAVYQEREKIFADFQYVTSTHSISMGSPPPGITSGRAFLVLQEADDSDLGPMIEMMEEAVAELGWLTLQIIQQFYEDERLIRISGENRRYQVRAFKGADLESIVDVEPQVGSAFPWSQTAKQSMMIDLVQAVPALFMDNDTQQFDAEKFRRMLPVGGEEALGLGSEIDINEALREEEDFEEWDGTPGTEPVIQPWQNHIVHIRQHERVLKSASFRKWPEWAQGAFLEHWAQTQMAIQEQQMRALQMQMMAQGGGEPPGEGNPKKPSGKSAENGGSVDEKDAGQLSAAERDPVSG
jgi:hypothetical protein